MDDSSIPKNPAESTFLRSPFVFVGRAASFQDGIMKHLEVCLLILCVPAAGFFLSGCTALTSNSRLTEAQDRTRTVEHTINVPSSPSPLRSPTVGGIASTWWKPKIGITWQWQLSGEDIDISIAADVYDIDLFDNGADTVASLQLQGRRVVCYLSAGSWEDWRPDAAAFPKEILGKDYEGRPGAKWLDIRQIDKLASILGARLDLCKAKGFDAVEPDNVDGYQNETGFPLTGEDQSRFNRWLAQEAHRRGLAIALKNDADQTPDLVADFDFALTEDCFEQDWCDLTLPFLQNGKPVLDAEYTDTGITLSTFCPRAGELGIRAILKHRTLDAWRQVCP